MGFSLGRFSVYFDFTFFAVTVLFLSTDAAQYWWWTFSALLLHELGHLVAAKLVGIDLVQLRFSCFGITLQRRGILSGWRQEAVVFLGGPAVNLCCAGILSVLEKPFPFLSMPREIHLIMGIFQLLPIGALDGGCLSNALLHHFFSSMAADRAGIILSAAVLVPLSWLGWLLLQGPQRNFTLLLCCGFLIFSILWEGS